MVRKTVSLEDSLYSQLDSNGLTARFGNFSELVATALRFYADAQEKEAYRRQLEAAARDPLFLADVEEVMNDFCFADGEHHAV